jgi:hypothetical protein
MPLSPEEADRRDRRFRHCGFKGDIIRMRIALQAMISAKTTTEETKDLARKIEKDAGILLTHVKTRID